MKTYICLLRAINVGGKNRLPMAELKKVLEQAGCQDVKTYINSGNVIFRSSRDNLQDFCQTLLKEQFGLSIACQILSAETLLVLAEQVPDWFNQSPDNKYNAIFTIAPWTSKDVIQRMPAIRDELEQLVTAEQVIFWTCAKKDFSRTSYSKLAAKADVYAMTTVRNGNTFFKLVGLARDYLERFGT